MPAGISYSSTGAGQTISMWSRHFLTNTYISGSGGSWRVILAFNCLPHHLAIVLSTPVVKYFLDSSLTQEAYLLAKVERITNHQKRLTYFIKLIILPDAILHF